MSRDGKIYTDDDFSPAEASRNGLHLQAHEKRVYFILERPHSASGNNKNIERKRIVKEIQKENQNTSQHFQPAIL